MASMWLGFLSAMMVLRIDRFLEIVCSFSKSMELLQLLNNPWESDVLATEVNNKAGGEWWFLKTCPASQWQRSRESYILGEDALVESGCPVSISNQQWLQRKCPIVGLVDARVLGLLGQRFQYTQYCKYVHSLSMFILTKPWCLHTYYYYYFLCYFLNVNVSC